MFALVDCNNFFASCERVFDPTIRNKPIVVLSSNDGCVVARSAEAKKIGIPMGQPVYKCKDLLERYNVRKFSANFNLYGDMSKRVNTIAREHCPDIEVYSIDESFLDLSGMKIANTHKFGEELCQDIYKQTGLQVSVGIADTKTLAKLANHAAKKVEGFHGVCDFTQIKKEQLRVIMSKIEVGEIWGIGWNYSKFLNKNGIYTVLDFVNADEMWVKDKMGVSGRRTLMELRGTPCVDIHIGTEPSKTIISSRSFRKKVSDKKELIEAVTEYTATAAEKLREQGSAAGYLQVSLLTEYNNKTILTGWEAKQKFYNSDGLSISTATSYTPDLVKVAMQVLDGLYQEGTIYKKAGIMLSAIVPDDSVQMNYFEPEVNHNKKSKIMSAVDKINKKNRKRVVKYGSSSFNPSWSARSEMRSKAFTTKWEELLEIRI